jgi:hypothetical protein
MRSSTFALTTLPNTGPARLTMTAVSISTRINPLWKARTPAQAVASRMDESAKAAMIIVTHPATNAPMSHKMASLATRRTTPPIFPAYVDCPQVRLSACSKSLKRRAMAHRHMTGVVHVSIRGHVVVTKPENGWVGCLSFRTMIMTADTVDIVSHSRRRNASSRLTRSLSHTSNLCESNGMTLHRSHFRGRPQYAGAFKHSTGSRGAAVSATAA